MVSQALWVWAQMRLTSVFPHAAAAMNFIGADILLGSAHRGVGSIIVMHSIVNDRREHLLDRLRTSVSFLSALIAHYRAAGVDIVSLDEALVRAADSASPSFVSFTFDDGYRDNLTLALPLFERHDAPFTVFVTTCFANRSMFFWWAGLAELLKRVDKLDVPVLGQSFPVGDYRAKTRAYRVIGRAVDTGELSVDALLRLLRHNGISCAEILDREALTEDEIVQLSRHRLVTIGGHTDTHPKIAKLSAGEARREMQKNKAWLEQLTGRAVDHFAFPHGDRTSCGPRDYEIARDVGFRSGLTTQIGNLSQQSLACPTGLPRLRPFNQHESIRILEFQRSGAANAVAAYLGGAAAIS